MKYISTNNMNRDDWLKRRKEYIGASDWGSVLGQNKWKTPIDLYHDKIGESEPQEDNIKMKFGRDVEDLLARWFEENTGLTVFNDNKIRFSEDYPFLGTNLDRVIRDDNGDHAVLELKTMGMSYYKKLQSEGLEIPLSYYSQVQAQLFVTGWTKAYLAVLLIGFSGPEEFKIFEYPADDVFIKMALPRLEAFWKCVKDKTPPEPTIYDALPTVFSVAEEGKETEATPELLEDVEKYDNLMAEIKGKQAEANELKSMIQLAMGDAEYLKHLGETLHTWKQTKPRTTFDSKNFKIDHPDLYVEYLKTGKPGRRFM